VADEAVRSLKNVCKWADDLRRTEPAEHGRSHDIAVFLTRRSFGPAGAFWLYLLLGEINCVLNRTCPSFHQAVRRVYVSIVYFYVIIVEVCGHTPFSLSDNMSFNFT